MKTTLRPLFVGLPGAGKTTLSALVAERLGFSVIGTDPLFRIFRAIPSTSEDPRAEVMRSFLDEAEKRWPDLAPKLRKDAETVDEKGRCVLHDSVPFRAYGEDVFRRFEIEMFAWLDRHGELDNKIADLSASAPLYAENRALFSPENGYRAILIDTPHAMIGQNLVKDYLRFLERSRAAGEKKPIRGAYEKEIAAALGDADPTTPEGAKIAYEAALRVTEREAGKRWEKYVEFTRGVAIHPAPGVALETLVDQVCALCEA